MGAVEYKVFFDGTAATAEQLDKIDELTVDQAVDRAWEAKLKIPVCVNNDGRWEGEDEAWMRPYSKIRVEVNAGDGQFVPLIDGPVVGFDSERSPQPGKSVVTVVVHDDSAMLNRRAEVRVVEGQLDSDLASQIFTAAGFAADVEPTPAHPDRVTAASAQRGTPMQYLRDLAARNQDWHAYVLPGRKSGQPSTGCFKRFAEDVDGLPEMVLLGPDRNLNSFNVNNRAQNPCTVRASSLRVTDKGVVSASASYRDATLLGDQPPDEGNPEPGECLLPAGQSDRVDLTSATRGAAAASGFSLEATGAIVPFCYPAALSPYRWVLVRISDSKFSTKYLITQVTHKLTRSIYTQTFQAKGNGVTVAAGAAAGAPQPSADLGISFNVQVSIF